MKKKIFLSGVNAKLALAAVALTSVMFTSCEKEEFNVAPVELDPASATVAITVYDLSDGSIINGASITENGAAITSNPLDDDKYIFHNQKGIKQYLYPITNNRKK